MSLIFKEKNPIFKEKGYDEFLAQQIQLAEAQLVRGEFVGKEEMNTEVEALFVQNGDILS